MELSRFLNTIKYLKGEQLWFQAFYKVSAILRRAFRIKRRYARYSKGCPLNFAPFPLKSESYKGDGKFTFLNVDARFCGVWDDRAQGDLWSYNLNYMDFLLQPSMTAAEGCEWIMRFIDSAPGNSFADAPYPISLRGINWIKFLSLHSDKIDSGVLGKIDRALYSQYRVLSGRTERHLLANHYLENGFSLLFGAVYFKDKRLWKQARRIVRRQLAEQILPDGAHFELSPMYHCIILERLLDCCNLLSSATTGLFMEQENLLDYMKQKAVAMLGWLDSMLLSNGSLPLLNDAANGIALQPEEVREYARRLNLDWGARALKESGYRHIRTGDYEAVVDIAPLGVSYNLGHSHADTLSFLLWVSGRPLLVDAGTSTYNACERRCYERSTRAHNTVVVNNENSSNVWGAFRCARRAQVTILSDDENSISASHDGYRAVGVTCTRSFNFSEQSLSVTDCVTGECEAKAYFHLAPSVKVLSVTENSVVTTLATFVFDGASGISVEDTLVAEEYNALQQSVCLCVGFSGTLCTRIKDFVL